jgi:hypothetical protein
MSDRQLLGKIEVDVVLVQPAPNHTRALVQVKDDAGRDLQVRPCIIPRAHRPHWHPVGGGQHGAEEPVLACDTAGSRPPLATLSSPCRGRPCC